MTSMNERLRSYRDSLGLSQEYVAKQLGVSRTAIIAIENGERNVLAKELDLFSNIYGVTVEQILYGEKTEGKGIEILTGRVPALSENDKEEIVSLMNFKKN